MLQKTLYTAIDKRAAEFEGISDAIWEHPQIAYEEEFACTLQRTFLEKEGFRVVWPVANIPTAFYAEYGTGAPVIGLLGEYDALPRLSQKAGSSEHDPLVADGPGHGCGHHMLGACCMETAVAIKQAICEGSLQGTIRYYGCPAEEGGAGKIYMLRAGAFQDCDIALTYHGANEKTRLSHRTKATLNSTYTFSGKACGVVSAWNGASALDAAELMNIGANFLREHIMPGEFVSYSFLDAGSPAANVVPDHAKLLYSIRCDDLARLQYLHGRIEAIAKSAANMTETTVDGPVVKSAYAPYLENRTLVQLLRELASSVYPVSYTKQEQMLAAAFLEKKGTRTEPLSGAFCDADGVCAGGATDIGDVSWFVPSIIIRGECFVSKAHTWKRTAEGKTTYAKKGMHAAAKLMAAAAARLMQDESLVTKAKADLEESKNGQTYISALPATASPWLV